MAAGTAWQTCGLPPGPSQYQSLTGEQSADGGGRRTPATAGNCLVPPAGRRYGTRRRSFQMPLGALRCCPNPGISESCWLSLLKLNNNVVTAPPSSRLGTLLRMCRRAGELVSCICPGDRHSWPGSWFAFRFDNHPQSVGMQPGDTYHHRSSNSPGAAAAWAALAPPLGCGQRRLRGAQAHALFVICTSQLTRLSCWPPQVESHAYTPHLPAHRRALPCSSRRASRTTVSALPMVGDVPHRNTPITNNHR